MLIGFVRLSEHEPPSDLDAQRRALKAAGVEKVFTSGSTLRGPQAARDRAACVDFCREGDTLVVSRPDRLARGAAELIKTADALSKRGVGLVVLSGFGAPLSSLDGVRPAMIARILKIGRSTVYRYLPPGYRVTPKPKREPRERLDARTVQVLVAAGVRTGRIAESLGCSKSSVRRLSRV